MPGSVFLENDPVTLRPATDEDIAFLRENQNDPHVRATRHAHRPADEDWARRRLGGTMGRSDDSIGLLVCVDDAPVGFVRLIREHPWVHVTRDAELGYWITPDEWRNGYATAAAECMVEYGFSELGLHRITASALTTNEASKRVLKRVGFVEEGVSRDASFVDGEWCDMVRYGLLVEERDLP
ncbi:GNAT family protein [Haladaptatus sp. DYF46]|uniref:GNAT family N-acetyltransferase n=1 Tax=Haladaptatus sp. DYF46 TaxID=2886041 RepID=UPI001E5AE379|nr:GNAT family protein [Haladaptatus sp. DYF46]